jgi:glycosyltransferase involved in cell wall biosynthesis
MVLTNQIIQRAMVKDLIRSHGINVVHQPIPVSPKAPSLIKGFGAPVVMGPMNGGMDYPDAFRSDESIFTRAYVWVGRLCATLVNRVIAGKRHASVLLVANERTRAALPGGRRGTVVEMPENGVDLAIWSAPPQAASPTPGARFIFVGRLVDWKRLDFVLQALVSCTDATLDVIGEGPMRDKWAAMANTLGVADRVHWLGWLPQPECAQHLRGATALLLPSIYECGGAVVLEAMACAVPVIALAWGGPAEYLDASCGILISPANAESIVDGFVNAQTTLAKDPVMRARLGEAGRKRAELHFDWNGKIDRILGIYRQSIAQFRP